MLGASACDGARERVLGLLGVDDISELDLDAGVPVKATCLTGASGDLPSASSPLLFVLISSQKQRQRPSLLVCEPSDESIEKVKAELADYKRQVTDEGADFGDLAARHSDEPGAFRSRGYLGEFSRGVMVSEFEAIVFQMRPGEISDPFRTEYGFGPGQYRALAADFEIGRHGFKDHDLDKRVENLAFLARRLRAHPAHDDDDRHGRG